MAADSRFGLVFFEDAGRSKLIKKLGGHWLARKDLLLYDTIGEKKYNIYRYQIIDQDTVYAKSVTSDQRCRLPAYTLHRMPG